MVGVDWSEYHRRLAIRDARRAEVRRLLGFSTAPRQLRTKHPRGPGHSHMGEALTRAGRVVSAPAKRSK